MKTKEEKSKGIANEKICYSRGELRKKNQAIKVKNILI